MRMMKFLRSREEVEEVSLSLDWLSTQIFALAKRLRLLGR